MSQCAAIKSKLIPYLEYQLTPSEETEVRKHTESCPGCEDELVRIAEKGNEKFVVCRNALDTGMPVAGQRLSPARLSLTQWLRPFVTAAAAVVLVCVIWPNRYLPSATAIAAEARNHLQEIGTLVYRITVVDKESIPENPKASRISVWHYDNTLQFLAPPQIKATIAPDKCLISFSGPSAFDRGNSQLSAYFCGQGDYGWWYQSNYNLLKRGKLGSRKPNAMEPSLSDYATLNEGPADFLPPIPVFGAYSGDIAKGDMAGMLKKLAADYTFGVTQIVKEEGKNLYRCEGKAKDKISSSRIEILYDPERKVIVSMSVYENRGNYATVYAMELQQILTESEAIGIFDPQNYVPDDAEEI